MCWKWEEIEKKFEKMWAKVLRADKQFYEHVPTNKGKFL